MGVGPGDTVPVVGEPRNCSGKAPGQSVDSRASKFPRFSAKRVHNFVVDKDMESRPLAFVLERSGPPGTRESYTGIMSERTVMST